MAKEKIDRSREDGDDHEINRPSPDLPPGVPAKPLKLPGKWPHKKAPLDEVPDLPKPTPRRST